MNIQPLSVGPIVGETTPNQARIWGRGDTDVVNGMPRRCFGAIRVRAAGDAWLRPELFKMNPNFDLTGVAVLRRLQADQLYEYEIGYFLSETEPEDTRLNNADWNSASSGSFTTGATDEEAPRSIVVGSCRYLLKTFLGDFYDNRGDKTFRSIVRQIDDGMRTDQMLMIGDQIYADDLNAFNPDKTVAQFYKRYRYAFSQPWIRKLMSVTPTYMTLDDHEIEDNWPSKATDKDLRTLFPVAIHAYQAYQLAHSPAISLRRGRLDGTPKKLWYSYTDGCCDVFITDSRTERSVGSEREMLGMDQTRILKRWLSDGSGKVKIVVTSVPFFPDAANDEEKDKWSGFPDQRKELLTLIEEKSINKVIFLSGDIHASMSSELISQNGVKVISIISSAFFWPYPHPSAKKYKLRGSIDGGAAGEFTLHNVSKMISDDNFSRLNITPDRVTVDVYSRKGKLITSNEHQFIGN